MKSTCQVMGPKRAYPGCQKGNRLPILLMMKRKVMTERKKEREERIRRTRRVVRERMTRIRVRAVGVLLWKEVQEAQGMVILVLLSFLRYEPLMILS